MKPTMTRRTSSGASVRLTSSSETGSSCNDIPSNICRLAKTTHARTETRQPTTKKCLPNSVTVAKPIVSAAVSRPEQRPKALRPMNVTEEGMVMEVRPVQSEKAPSPMDVTEEGMMMEVRPVQS